MANDTLVSLFDNSIQNHSGRIAVRSQVSGREWSYGELDERARRVAGYLTEHGIEKGDYVAVVCENDMGFAAVNTGIHKAGAVTVPMNQNLSPERLYQDYLHKVKPKIILADAKNIEKISKYAGDTEVVPFEEALNGFYFSRDSAVTPQDRAVVIFSSGTTSDSLESIKGVVLSHGNVASNVLATEEVPRYREDKLGEGQGTYLAGLAAHWHSFEFMIQHAFYATGGLVHFTDMDKFMANQAAAIHPHYAIMVPRAANILMNKVKREIRRKSEKNYERFEWFLKHSTDYHFQRTNEGKTNVKEYLLNLIADRKIYSKIRESLREKFGNNDPLFVGGSAPLDKGVELFFWAIGLPIFQGYGLTETSPVLSVNLPWAHRFGSSGKPIKGVDILIADTEKFENSGLIIPVEEGEEGLILVKGPNVFMEYIGDAEATRNAFRDGWFNTDDLGSMKEGFLYINGRKKDLICLSKGEKVNPAPIETHYNSRGLEMILVGNNQTRVGSLIVADAEQRRSLLEKDEGTILEGICRTSLADAEQRFGIKFTRKNTALLTDLDKHPELKTGTMKVKRKLVEKQYHETVARICNF